MQKLKQLLLDEKYQTPAAAQVTTRRRSVIDPQPDNASHSMPRHSMLWGSGITLVIALVLSLVFSDISDGGTTKIATDPRPFARLMSSMLLAKPTSTLI